MKKLKLNVEELTVDTFHTGDTNDVRGTVDGAENESLDFCTSLDCKYTPGTRLTCCPCTPAF